MKQKSYSIKAATADEYVRNLRERYGPPAEVFCSRDLERGLIKFVGDEMLLGHCPSDDALRAQARKILGVEHTAADDIFLLEKFKALHGIVAREDDPTGGAVGVGAATILEAGTGVKSSAAAAINNPPFSNMNHDICMGVHDIMDPADDMFAHFEMDLDLSAGMNMDMVLDLGLANSGNMPRTGCDVNMTGGNLEIPRMSGWPEGWLQADRRASGSGSGSGFSNEKNVGL